MPRYFCTVEYDGRPFKGFQAQGNLPTVQASLERAIFKFSGETLRLTAAGRTDTGVHATGQMISFDLQRDYDPDTVRDAMNALLRPEPIAILTADKVHEDWSARFSATGRMYLYRILARRAPPALDQGRVWHVRKPLDADIMQEAAQVLLGTHDFTTFRHAECQAKSPVKTLELAQVARVGEEVHCVFGARSFLHRQVRSLVGTLVEAGIGRWSVSDVKAALEAKDRTACGQVAPPDGLYLTHTLYEPEPNFAKYSSINR